MINIIKVSQERNSSCNFTLRIKEHPISFKQRMIAHLKEQNFSYFLFKCLLDRMSSRFSLTFIPSPTSSFPILLEQNLKFAISVRDAHILQIFLSIFRTLSLIYVSNFKWFKLMVEKLLTWKVVVRFTRATLSHGSSLSICPPLYVYLSAICPPLSASLENEEVYSAHLETDGYSARK